MNSTKYIFDIFNAKRNNNYDRNVESSLVQYDGNSAKIFLQINSEDFNKNCNKSKYLPLKTNKRDIDSNVANNKENVRNETPFRNTTTPLRNAIFDDICSNAIKWKNSKAKKDENPLCNLFCKLPKVTSASAISPERQSHYCHNQIIYDSVPKDDIDKELKLTIDNSLSMSTKKSGCQVKSINSYRYPISSFPESSKELLPSIVSSSKENDRLFSSDVFKNKDKSLKNKPCKYIM